MSKYYDTLSAVTQKPHISPRIVHFSFKNFAVFGSAVIRPKAPFLASDHAANNPKWSAFSFVKKQITQLVWSFFTQTKEPTENMDTWTAEEAVADVSEHVHQHEVQVRFNIISTSSSKVV